MAWHSKRHNIKHKKAATDAKKAKIYTKIWKIIEMAARNWADPSLNPSLVAALDKARYNSVPREVIDRAIKKGSGQAWWENLEEAFYEWYGPAGTALYIKAITWNKNRSASTIRAILTKFGGNLWEPGSVAWQFKEKWVIFITGKSKWDTVKWNQVETVLPLDMDEFEEVLMETDVENYEVIEEWVNVITRMEDFINIKKFLEKDKSYKIWEADIKYIPENYVELSDEQMEKFERLLDNLEEDDDVEEIFHNV